MHGIYSASKASPDRVRKAISCFDKAQQALVVEGEDNKFYVCDLLSSDLAQSLGDVGLSADYINSAYLLTPGRVGSANEIVLFEEDGAGDYLILQHKGEDEHGNADFATLGSGKFEDGSIQQALAALL